MKIEELEQKRPYRDSMAWIKDPEQAQRDGISVPVSGSQPSTSSQITALRDSQLPLLAKLAVSPESAPNDSLRPIWLVRIGPTDRELRRPGLVAGEFLAWFARDVRVSGLVRRTAVSLVADGLSPAERAFVSVLRWLGDRDLYHFMRLNDDIIAPLYSNGGYRANAGAVLGSLLMLYLMPNQVRERELTRELGGEARWIADVLGRDPWTLAFLRAGVEELAALDRGIG